MGLIGDLTMKEVRASGDDLLAQIAEATNLPHLVVRRRVNAAHSNAPVRSVFVDEWPDLAGELADVTVASARANGMADKIAHATGLDEPVVALVLDRAPARKHIRNAFDFAWPGKVERDQREQHLRDILADETVGAIRQYDLYATLANAFSLNEQAVRESLSSHRANKQIKNISFDADESPPNEEGARPADADIDSDEKTMLALLPENGSAIGNGSLRAKLQWDESRYYLVRGELLQKGLIWLGKGRGGSVMLASGWMESRRKELFALVPNDGSPISNTALMRQLGWDQAFYDDIKDQLEEEGLLQTGRGRSGSVYRSRPSPLAQSVGSGAAGLQGALKTSTIKIFISYSHKDESLRDELEVHLASLRRDNLIDQWHHRRIGAGDDWKKAIDEHLDRSSIVLLLVSPDFIASDYCYDIEMTRAVNRHARGEARVIPIIIRHSDWNNTPFARFQALPRDGKPVKSWPDRDEAWLDVVRGVRAEVEKLTARSR
ncbi:toll/interleukin-1 receptor domain-containing protein [Sorangium sp. So ce448]|uniref:toll/interleukin-1 receptor domain-containing protein n=1 Tax=Sorangium sp. So ce448 TaxID=3133314 RepID=UPI003F630EF5